MIEAGKIDLILCKSISRFARNTVLTIQTIRELKAIGVEVYFDKERMSTFDEKTEFMLSIMSSMAQEESRHISENVRWTFQKMMKEGKAIITTSRFLGYTKGEDGNLEIVPEEAEIVRLIYTMYDQGYEIFDIRKALREKGYKTVSGNDYWHLSTLQGILRNEKYKGDLLLQKTFTLDYLTHKAKKNKGEVPSYYVTNSHEPIIDPAMWDKVQERIKLQSMRMVGANRDLNKYNTRYPLSGMLICYYCGQIYKRRHWIKGYKNPKIMYQCNGYVEPKTGNRCEAKPVGEKILLKACAEVINELFLSGSKVFDKISKVMDTIFQGKQTSGALQEKEKCEIDIKTRYKKIKELIDGKKVTPEMITKDMLDVFLYRIIVLSRNEVVFTINASRTMSLEDLRKKRKEVASRQPVYEHETNLRGTKKKFTLHYKVVLV